MLKYLFDGGIFMWVILLASISGLAVIIEKMYCLCYHKLLVGDKF